MKQVSVVDYNRLKGHSWLLEKEALVRPLDAEELAKTELRYYLEDNECYRPGVRDEVRTFRDGRVLLVDGLDEENMVVFGQDESSRLLDALMEAAGHLVYREFMWELNEMVLRKVVDEYCKVTGSPRHPVLDWEDQDLEDHEEVEIIFTTEDPNDESFVHVTNHGIRSQPELMRVFRIVGGVKQEEFLVHHKNIEVQVKVGWTKPSI